MLKPQTTLLMQRLKFSFLEVYLIFFQDYLVFFDSLLFFYVLDKILFFQRLET